MKRLLALVLACVGALCAAAQGQIARLAIVETSDVHGNYFPYDFKEGRPGAGSLARVCSYVDSLRRALTPDGVVLLDCGDILQGQSSAYYYNFVDTTSAHLCARMLSFMGYDAAAVGNHDVETGHPVYDRWTAACRFPVLAANAQRTADGSPYWPPFTIVERGGVRVGVVGLVTPGIPTWLPRHLWSGMAFADILATTRHYVGLLRDSLRADLVVGLMHTGAGQADAAQPLAENAALRAARSVVGLDLVLCGHDHRPLVRWVVNVAGDSVLVLNPGAQGLNVARADVSLRRQGQGWTVSHMEGRLVSVADREPDADFCRTFAADEQAVRRFTEQVVGHNATTLTSRESFFGPSAFVDLVHDVQLAVSGAQLSLTAPIALDATIPAGELRMADMFKLYPYENQLCVMRLTGREVKDYLEYSYDHWVRQMGGPDEAMLRFRVGADTIAEPWQRLAYASYNFDSAAGLRYTVDVSQPAGQRVAIEALTDGTPFRPDAVYSVAINSYRAGGGGGLLTAGAGLAKDSLEERITWRSDRDLRHYLTQHIGRHTLLRAAPRGEWRFVPEVWAAAAAQRDSLLLFGPAQPSASATSCRP